jgi:hypothetical protein
MIVVQALEKHTNKLKEKDAEIEKLLSRLEALTHAVLAAGQLPTRDLPDELIALPAGSYYTEPAGLPHFVTTKSEGGGRNVWRHRPNTANPSLSCPRAEIGCSFDQLSDGRIRACGTKSRSPD